MHRRRQRLREGADLPMYTVARQDVQHFCTLYGTTAKQHTIRVATTKENIGTLPHAMAHNQDARAGGAIVNELVDL
jgi:hypothetical protein